MSDKDKPKDKPRVLFCWKCGTRDNLRCQDTVFGIDLQCNSCKTTTRWERDDNKKYQMIPLEGTCDLCDLAPRTAVCFAGDGVSKIIQRCPAHPILQEERDELLAQWEKEVKEKKEADG